MNSSCLNVNRYWLSNRALSEVIAIIKKSNIRYFAELSRIIKIRELNKVNKNIDTVSNK